MIDKDTFCYLIKLYEKAMYHLAFSIVKNDADAAEVISESIFRAYKHLDLLKDVAAFKSWILKIVRNTAVEYIRKNSKLISLNEIETADFVSNDTSVINSLSLKETIKRLNEPYASVIILYYYEDLTISQIAKITSTSTANVKKRLSRAREKLREFFKEDLSNE